MIRIQKTSKLSLNKETLRTLSSTELRGVVGGTALGATAGADCPAPVQAPANFVDGGGSPSIYGGCPALVIYYPVAVLP
jgi:hypothetical protein